MKKIIKKYGNSLVIVLDTEDSVVYNFKEGDIVEIDIKKEDPKKWMTEIYFI